jgi:hypothetical protein
VILEGIAEMAGMMEIRTKNVSSPISRISLVAKNKLTTFWKVNLP